MMLEQHGDSTLLDLQTQWEWGVKAASCTQPWISHPALDPTPQAQLPAPAMPVPVTPILIGTLRRALIYRIPFFFFSSPFKSLSGTAAKPRLPSLLIVSAAVTALELSTRPSHRMRPMAALQWGPKGAGVTWGVPVVLGFPLALGSPAGVGVCGWTWGPWLALLSPGSTGSWLVMS